MTFRPFLSAYSKGRVRTQKGECPKCNCSRAHAPCTLDISLKCSAPFTGFCHLRQHSIALAAEPQITHLQTYYKCSEHKKLSLATPQRLFLTRTRSWFPVALVVGPELGFLVGGHSSGHLEQPQTPVSHTSSCGPEALGAPRGSVGLRLYPGTSTFGIELAAYR